MKRELKGRRHRLLRLQKAQESHEERIESGKRFSEGGNKTLNLMKRELKVALEDGGRRQLYAAESHEERIESALAPSAPSHREVWGIS